MGIKGAGRFFFFLFSFSFFLSSFSFSSFYFFSFCIFVLRESVFGFTVAVARMDGLMMLTGRFRVLMASVFASLSCEICSGLTLICLPRTLHAYNKRYMSLCLLNPVTRRKRLTIYFPFYFINLGTVVRSKDHHIIHANIDTDVIIRFVNIRDILAL